MMYTSALWTAWEMLAICAFLNLRYGDVDGDNGEYVDVNFDRVCKEYSPIPGVTVTAAGITLAPGGTVRLGRYHLIAFDQIRITYQVSGVIGSKPPVLDLKSSGTHTYGSETGYNMTDSLAYTVLPDGSED